MAGNGTAERPGGTPEGAMRLLRDRTTPAAALRRIAGEARLTAVHEVKALLARHPSSPLALARRFLPHLPWVELAEIARDLRVGPVLRRDAERLLEARLPEMVVGERISLARGASRRVLTALRSDPEGSVLRALLENPRATDADASIFASSPDRPLRRSWSTSPAILASDTISILLFGKYTLTSLFFSHKILLINPISEIKVCNTNPEKQGIIAMKYEVDGNSGFVDTRMILLLL